MGKNRSKGDGRGAEKAAVKVAAGKGEHGEGAGSSKGSLQRLDHYEFEISI
ncbi:hypothetical protein NM2005040_1630 [Neisseria meningitidis 2005040]|nr:hypothetical protein NM2005040_1630 [Neisseria meningitidis 2005040]